MRKDFGSTLERLLHAGRLIGAGTFFLFWQFQDLSVWVLVSYTPPFEAALLNALQGPLTSAHPYIHNLAADFFFNGSFLRSAGLQDIAPIHGDRLAVQILVGGDKDDRTRHVAF